LTFLCICTSYFPLPLWRIALAVVFIFVPDSNPPLLQRRLLLVVVVVFFFFDLLVGHLVGFEFCCSICGSAAFQKPSCVVSDAGWEQGFFIRDMYLKPPNLLYTGRTVLGALSAHNRQTDMNYFGPMAPRVKSFMERMPFETQKLLRPACYISSCCTLTPFVSRWACA